MYTKNYFLKVVPAWLAILAAFSCKKNELNTFNDSPAVNFDYAVNRGFLEYSFLGNPSNEYILKVPVVIMGDSTSADRQFAVEVVRDTNTTATDNMYQILQPVIRAGKFRDSVYIKLFKVPEISTKKVTLKIRLTGNSNFKAPAVEMATFPISWSNTVVVPSWTYYRFFFTSVASTAAYRIIVQTTGLTTLTAAQYGALGSVGATAYGTQFGDYIKQWNKDNPTNKLKHDDGTQAGQEMVPLYYTHSKYD